MNVKEFKEIVAALPAELDDVKVYAAIDDEGNGYNELYYAPSVSWTHREEISPYHPDDLEEEWAEYGDEGQTLDEYLKENFDQIVVF